MAAFDKILSGIAGMDEALDFIRLGDNVVFQVSDLEEYFFFARSFAAQALKDGKKLIYIRFAQHEAVLEPCEGLRIYEFQPEQGFESFTVGIHERIREEGREAFYVFDCLSQLQSVWYTDLMMGNFFRVTCPYLFQLDTVAFFPLIRGRHSFDAVARIRDTTQLFLDVYADRDSLYLHPLKVWNRYSGNMFLPHVWNSEKQRFEAVTDGMGIGRYYVLRQEKETTLQDLNADSHDRFFTMAKMQYGEGRFSEETEAQIIESTMTRDEKMQELIKKYFTGTDYFALRDRMIGSGAIGGKACGMLLARKIAEKELPAYQGYYEPHDSFYIGSDVFYTYIVANGCWDMRIAQRTEDGYFSEAGRLREGLLKGSFPSNIREQFRTMLDYFGQTPIIVRSSSFLEDGFGNAFAGKYESVFCANRGMPEERLAMFENAVRQVYASTMDISALEYRRQRGLEGKDEQMAVLVQRVSGSYYGNLYMPCAAGVGYSYSTYKLQKDIRPDEGMLRLVMGLGTKAVDRTENDYPRLVNLDRPTITMARNTAEKHRFSQHKIDVLDLEKNTLAEKDLEQVLPDIPEWLKRLLLEHDYEAEQRLYDSGRPRNVWFVSCQKLLEKETFTELMKALLRKLQQVYGNPVDIEYTVNCAENGDFMLNLLQCRPLYVGPEGGGIKVPLLKKENCFFDIHDACMGHSVCRKLDGAVLIDPKAYYEYPYARKPEVAGIIGKLNKHFNNQKEPQNILLIVPGRLGTSSPELGIPTTFADISGFCGICEVSDDRAGYMPELSFGSHMFQDLVEADIFYAAIDTARSTVYYQKEAFTQYPDIFTKLCSEEISLNYMISVYNFKDKDIYLWMDAPENHAACGIK